MHADSIAPTKSAVKLGAINMYISGPQALGLGNTGLVSHSVHCMLNACVKLADATLRPVHIMSIAWCSSLLVQQAQGRLRRVDRDAIRR